MGSNNPSANIYTSVNILKIHALNVNSIVNRSKRHYLSQHLKAYKPDFLLLSETCLRPPHKLHFENYNLIRSDKNGNTRGTGIIIKKELKYKQLIIPNLGSIEHTAVTLKDSRGRTLIVVAIYAHQNSELNLLGNIFDICHPDDFVVCGGDFNARHPNWSNYATNLNGMRLNRWLNDFADPYNIKLLHSLLPSRFDAYSHSFIDLFLITKNIKTIPLDLNRLDSADFDSDHRAIVLNIEIPLLETIQPIFIKNYAKANWKELSRLLSSELPNLYPPTDRNLTNPEIEAAIVSLNKAVVDAIELHVPNIKLNLSTLICLNDLTLSLIKRKKLIRRRWFNGGRSNNLLKSLINRLSTLIEEMINLQYAKNLEKILINIKPGPKLFNDIKKVSNYKKHKFAINIEGCRDEGESAEALAEYFEQVYNNSPAACEPPNPDVEEFIQSISSDNNRYIFQFSAASPSDKSIDSSRPNYECFSSVKNVTEIIWSRKNLKSSGTSLIPNVVLRKLPPAYATFLTIICNNALNNSFFPSAWKQAIVVPIPKKNSLSHDRTHYRPISLLCCESKIYECLIKDILFNISADKNIVNKLQFGFTKGLSTSHALTYLQEHIHIGFNSKESCLALAIDLQKAFDSVWIKGLIFKLRIFGFPVYICKLLLCYLSNRKFKVKVNEAFSSLHEIKAGVPQGAILAPLLFNMYISDFPLDWQNGIKAIFFADDILLFKTNTNISQMITEFNSYAVTVMEYLDRWKLRINSSKCESILFRKYESYIRGTQKIFKKNENVKISLGGQYIMAKNQIKYLGVVLDRKGSIVHHVKEILKKAQGAFILLKGVFGRKTLSTRVKEICFKQLIRPILSYGFIAWCSISAHQMSLLRSFERKVLYKCLPASEAYYFDNSNDCHKLISKKALFKKFPKFQRFDTMLNGTAVRFMDKLEFSPVNFLKDISDPVYLNERYDSFQGNYKYKSFPPSFFYYLHKRGLTVNAQGILTFYNRRYNSGSLDEYVYDLMEPD